MTLRACVLLSAALCACAAGPPRTSYEGVEEIGLMAKADHWLGATIDGARCALSNDKGAWTLVTTGTARVERSIAPLRIECSKDGFEPALVALKCISPRERSKPSDNARMGVGLAVIPIGLAAGPAGLGGLVAAEGAVLAGLGASRQAADDTCTYEGGVVVMKRAKP